MACWATSLIIVQAFETEDGTIYLGSIDGFIAFNPKNFSENKFIPSVAITDFFLFGKKVYAGEPGSPLEKSITFSDRTCAPVQSEFFFFPCSSVGFPGSENEPNYV